MSSAGIRINFDPILGLFKRIVRFEGARLHFVLLVINSLLLISFVFYIYYFIGQGTTFFVLEYAWNNLVLLIFGIVLWVIIFKKYRKFKFTPRLVLFNFLGILFVYFSVIFSIFFFTFLLNKPIWINSINAFTITTFTMFSIIFSVSNVKKSNSLTELLYSFRKLFYDSLFVNLASVLFLTYLGFLTGIFVFSLVYFYSLFVLFSTKVLISYLSD